MPLTKASFEKLVAQLVYIEEHMGVIRDALSGGRMFPKPADVDLYFLKYTHRVETLFRAAKDEDVPDADNRLPFIVLNSSFTLYGPGGEGKRCRICPETKPLRRGGIYDIPFLSKMGLSLLLKEEGALAMADLGEGHRIHTVGPITIA